MIAALVVLIIVMAIALVQYLKAEVIKSFIMMIAAILSVTVAIGYYEIISDLLISKGYLINWVTGLSLLLIFALTFIVIQVISSFVVGDGIHFSDKIDKIASLVLGGVTGLVISGTILISLSMSPVPSKWLYSRYEADKFDINSSSAALIPADSVASGVFKMVAGGSMKSSGNFSVLHPNFLDQIHLDKLNSSKGVVSIVTKKAVKTKPSGSYWRPVGSYIDSKSGEVIDKDFVIYRAIFDPSPIKNGGVMNDSGEFIFTLTQCSLLVADNPKDAEPDTQAVYPIGYVKVPGQIEIKKNLAEVITLSSRETKNIAGYGNSVVIDLVFELPMGKKPVAFSFRNSAIVAVNKPVKEGQEPSTVSFIQRVKCEDKIAKFSDVGAVKVKPLRITGGEKFMAGLSLTMDVSSLNTIGYKSNGEEPLFSEGKIMSCKIVFSPTSSQIRVLDPKRAAPRNTVAMLGKMAGYDVVAVEARVSGKKNTKASDLPVLVDSNLRKHYPAGILVGGIKGNNYVYQLDYCGDVEKLTMVDGVVSKSYTDGVKITDQIDKIKEVQIIYLLDVRKGEVIITNAEVKGKVAGFDGSDGFVVGKRKVFKKHRRR